MKKKNATEELLMLLSDIAVENPHRHMHDEEKNIAFPTKGKIHKLIPTRNTPKRTAHLENEQMGQEAALTEARKLLAAAGLIPSKPNIFLHKSTHKGDVQGRFAALDADQEEQINIVAELLTTMDSEKGAELMNKFGSYLPELDDENMDYFGVDEAAARAHRDSRGTITEGEVLESFGVEELEALRKKKSRNQRNR